MTRKPYLNALAATAYISGVASLMYYGTETSGFAEESVLIPIAMLSLFVLSACVMGYIFCYEPIKLYLEDKKQESIDLFLKTIGFFAVITLSIFCALFVLSHTQF